MHHASGSCTSLIIRRTCSNRDNWQCPFLGMTINPWYYYMYYLPTVRYVLYPPTNRCGFSGNSSCQQKNILFFSFPDSYEIIKTRTCKTYFCTCRWVEVGSKPSYPSKGQHSMHVGKGMINAWLQQPKHPIYLTNTAPYSTCKIEKGWGAALAKQLLTSPLKHVVNVRNRAVTPGDRLLFSAPTAEKD